MSGLRICETCKSVLSVASHCDECVAQAVAAAYEDAARIAEEKTLVLSCSHDGHGIPDAIRARAREVAEKEGKA